MYLNSVLNLENPYKINVWPNPGSGVLHFDIKGLSLAGENDLYFYDPIGREVWHKTVEGNFFSIRQHNLSEGLYYSVLNDRKGRKIGNGTIHFN